jgi:hypothetical protein
VTATVPGRLVLRPRLSSSIIHTWPLPDNLEPEIAGSVDERYRIVKSTEQVPEHCSCFCSAVQDRVTPESTSITQASAYRHPCSRQLKAADAAPTGHRRGLVRLQEPLLANGHPAAPHDASQGRELGAAKPREAAPTISFSLLKSSAEEGAQRTHRMRGRPTGNQNRQCTGLDLPLEFRTFILSLPIQPATTTPLVDLFKSRL